MLYPPEIVDDFDDSGSQSDEANSQNWESESVKIVQKAKKEEFEPSGGGGSEGKKACGNEVDQLGGLRRFLKQNSTQTSLEERIRQERQRIWPKGNDELKLIEYTSNELNNDAVRNKFFDAGENGVELLQEAPNKTDRVRLKRAKNKRAKSDGAEQFFDSCSNQIAASANSARQLTFNDLNLSRPLLKAVSEAGFQCPTPIQTACIPVALAGRDICASSATGTGKTAAFMLPILERLLYRPSRRISVTRVLSADNSQNTAVWKFVLLQVVDLF
uniref:RNA helicase n=1 Tax=Globodera rostochiensis TaxID=31243 RepID=A0A914I8Q0_GLORO